MPGRLVRIARSAAARPAASSAGVGGIQRGCSRLIAAPQCAREQVESLRATSSKAAAASSYQNECRTATADSNRDWTDDAQVVAKATRPVRASVWWA